MPTNGAARDGALGPQIGEGADQDVGEPLARVVADRDRGRRLGVQHAPTRADDLDRAENPVVRRHRRIGHRADGEDDGGARARPRHVERARHLRRRARQVHGQTVAALHQAGVDPRRRTAASVVVHEPLGLGLAVGELAQQRASGALDDVDGLAEPDLHRVPAELLDQLVQPPLAEGARRALCAQVRDRGLRVADVLGQEIEHVAVVLPAPVQADRREDHALGVHLTQVRTLGPGIHPADVQVVRGRSGPGEEPAVHEDGLQDVHIGGVHRAQVRMVRDEHVAVVDLASPPFEDRAHHQRHRAELRRDEVGLGDEDAVRREERAAEVLHVADDRAVARALQHDAHLLGGRDEARVDQLEADRVERVRARAPRCRAPRGRARGGAPRGRAHVRPRSHRFPSSSILAAWPRPITTVESICSTIAGPSSTFLARSCSRR
jgi:hypothetical protein